MGNPNDMMDAEKTVKRNPHPDFKKVEASRPDFTPVPASGFNFTKAPNPNWHLGAGSNDVGASLEKKHVEIDPYAPGRPAIFNYKLLISGIIPRPIGFLGTRSKDGASNLAPYSFFNVISHNPPVFIVGFAGGFDKAKDSLKNLVETGEASINIISEHYIEAANASSINAPFGVSEWALSGLHPAPCTDIKASRVQEAVFSIEGKLMNTQEFTSRVDPGQKTAVMAVIEGVRFWAREDAINEDRNLLDPSVMRPVSRLGGITYGRTMEGFELPRPDYGEAMKSGDYEHLKKEKTDSQS